MVFSEAQAFFRRERFKFLKTPLKPCGVWQVPSASLSSVYHQEHGAYYFIRFGLSKVIYIYLVLQTWCLGCSSIQWLEWAWQGQFLTSSCRQINKTEHLNVCRGGKTRKGRQGVERLLSRRWLALSLLESHVIKTQPELTCPTQCYTT